MTGLIATDGLRARDNGIWGTEKLDFLSFFAPVALKATERMPSRHYVDLFAGPGLNRVRNGTQEYDGSPLLATEVTTNQPPYITFTDAWFINRDRRDYLALDRRIEARVKANRCRIPPSRIHSFLGDANQEVYRVLDAIPTQCFALVFADMEAPKQCPWSTISALRSYKGHRAIDLYLLFPLDMALRRLVSQNPMTVKQAAPTLDAFYGDRRWEVLLQYRKVESAANLRHLGQHALQLYIDRLREHWTHVIEVCDVRRGSSHRLYKMLFASNHDAGKRIAAWARRRSSQQGDLGL